MVVYGRRFRTGGSTLISNDKTIIGPWVAAKMGIEYSDNNTSLGQIAGSKIIAGVSYQSWNKASIIASIAVEGLMTPTYLAAIFHYPFIYLGVTKIICQVAESNLNSIKLAEKLGFRLEAQLLDAHPDGSLLIYTMTKEQCRFIGEKYVKRLRVNES